MAIERWGRDIEEQINADLQIVQHYKLPKLSGTSFSILTWNLESNFTSSFRLSSEPKKKKKKEKFPAAYKIFSKTKCRM